MKNKTKEIIPTIVRVNVPQTKFDPQNVDTEIYCVNTTEHEFFISTKSESFTTIDEEYGNTTSHGSKPISKKLSPGESIKIAEVKGWEWDGHVGIEVSFRQNENVITKNYNLKESKSDYKITNEIHGRIIEPSKF